MGRGSARLRVVRLRAPKVRKARGNVADFHEAGDVFMHRDSSIALYSASGAGSRLSWMSWAQWFGVVFLLLGL